MKYYIITKDGIHETADTFTDAYEKYKTVLSYGYGDVKIVKEVMVEIKEVEGTPV